MVIVATYDHVVDAHMTQSRLRGHGVDAVLNNDLIAGVYPLASHAVGGVEVRVPEDQVALAREVLELKPLEPEKLLHCPFCNSTEIDHRRLPFFAVLLIVVFGTLLPFSQKNLRCLDCKRLFPQEEAKKSD